MDTLVDFILNFYGPTPYLIIFGILLVCGLGVPIPEDITLFVGGVLAYIGTCDLVPMIIVSLVGVLLGDGIIFVLGAKYGRRLTKKWFFHKILPDDYGSFHAWFEGTYFLFGGNFESAFQSFSVL
jgi:membrane protein DedA with SNARE-associated domain